MADLLSQLPTDRNSPTGPEIQVIDYLFKKPTHQKPTTAEVLVKEFRDCLIAALLFVLLTRESVDKLIIKYFPQAENPNVLMGVKIIIFIILLYGIKNADVLYLKTKKTKSIGNK